MNYIRDFFDSIRKLNTISLAEVPDRLRYVLGIVRNPEAHQGIPLLLVGILIVIVLLILMTSIALAYLLFTRDKRANLSYAFYDEEGELVAQIPVEDVSAEDLALLSGRDANNEEEEDREEIFDDSPALREPTQTPLVRGLRNFMAASAALVLAVLFLGFGTQISNSCVQCHNRDEHRSSLAQGPHEKVACVRCHESGGKLASVTSNVFPRLSHMVQGAFVSRNEESFQQSRVVVPAQNCLKCHAEIAHEGVVKSESASGRKMRVSHKEFLESGARCSFCHGTDAITNEEISPGITMETCLRCHNAEIASTECKTCHVNSWALRRVSNEKGTGAFADRQMTATDPSRQCYRCHNPKSCDSCHGVRMPHEPDVVNVTGTSKAHRDLARRVGIQRCFKCHRRGQISPMGAHDCLGCHPNFSSTYR